MNRILLFCLLTCPASQLIGCDRPALSLEQLDGKLFVAQPTIRANPIKRVPLVAIIDFESPVEVTPALEISDGLRTWTQPWPVAAAKKHRLAALGLRPDREHKIRVLVETENCELKQASQPLSFRTPPLPDSFPPLDVRLAQPKRMEPGVTMFAANIWQNAVSVLDYGYIIALDNEGEVVWFCHTGDRIADMRILKNGHLLYQHGSYRYAYEIDILGRDINRWVAKNLTLVPCEDSIPVEIDTSHHDLLELPNGNFMTLATEIQHFDEFPTSEFDPDAAWEPAEVVCDAIVEFDPQNGKIKQRFHLRDILDEKRIGYISLGSFWKDKYDDILQAPSRDWSHANALLYLPDEDALIVSFRHLDCLIKLDWKTKRIRWILGDPEGWREPWQKYLLKPVGELEWMYHQHSPQITPRGTLMIFDNGNYRARPFNEAVLAPQNRSRVVEYRINEQAMSVEQIYEYKGPPHEPFYCPFYCEADWLPRTGNLLITDGGHVELSDGTPYDDVPGERQWARLFEIDRDGIPETVFEVRLDSGLGSEFGWSVYRAMRLPNLWSPFRIAPPSIDENHAPMERRPHVKRMP